MSLRELSDTHARLRGAVEDLYARRAALILAARGDGYSWPEIAEALDMTVHGAIKASKMTR